jgi:hypothetical protein
MTHDYKIMEQHHHWTSEEKLKFCGYGEWVEEVDSLILEYLGYEAAIIRVFKREYYADPEAYFGGHLCGYVRIPNTHPYFRNVKINLDCHDGITFNEIHEEHWIGFDCAHLGDYVPTLEFLRKTMPELIEIRKRLPIPEGMEDHPIYNPVYRNVNYCIDECKKIIEQLIKAATAEKVKDEG